jgi:hypothetical protein
VKQFFIPIEKLLILKIMHKTSPFTIIDQQLESLTVKQLLELRVKVDEFIEKKILSESGNQGVISHLSQEISPLFAAIYIQLLEQNNNKNNSLERVKKLVEEWMEDESNYDQETYPQIEEGLRNNRFSI